MSGPVFNEDFRIPDKFVGLVIGRGGEQIKRLQMESGCKIRIESEGDGSIERSCKLSGSQECIEEAKRMLTDIIRRGQMRENGGGQQQGGGQQGGYRDNNNYGNGGGFQRR